MENTGKRGKRLVWLCPKVTKSTSQHFKGLPINTLQLVSSALFQCHLFLVVLSRQDALLLSCVHGVSLVFVHNNIFSFQSSLHIHFLSYVTLESSSRVFYRLCYVRVFLLMVLLLWTRIMALHESPTSPSLSSARCCDITPAGRRTLTGFRDFRKST